MFLCGKCHNGKCFHASKSYGKCENCGRSAMCMDCKVPPIGRRHIRLSEDHKNRKATDKVCNETS